MAKDARRRLRPGLGVHAPWQASAQYGLDVEVRMRDFAHTGEALGVELGWKPGAFTALHAANLHGAAADLAESDPITEPLLSLLGRVGGTWTGTHKELLTGMKREWGADGELLVGDDMLRSKEWRNSVARRGIRGSIRRRSPGCMGRAQASAISRSA